MRFPKVSRPPEPGYRQPAIDVNDGPGRVREIAPQQRRHHAADVVGLPPAACGHEAVRDAAVVGLVDGRGHVGRDDTGPHLVQGNAVLGEPRGVQAGGHREARLADAVVAAIDRRHFRRHRRDEHDGRRERRIGATPLDLIARDRPASGNTVPADCSARGRRSSRRSNLGGPKPVSLPTPRSRRQPSGRLPRVVGV